MKTYKIQNRETGCIIEKGLTEQEAIIQLAEFEKEDKVNDTYVVDFCEIKEEPNIREIAETNGLTYIETTSGSNGYPSNIKSAIIGFETFAEAEKLADEHNLTIEFFKKKDGWQLWERTNNIAFEEMVNSCNDYGDNYSDLEKMSEEEFIKNEVAETITALIEDGADSDTIKNFIKDKRKLFNEIENMEDDEIVITCHGEYYETIKSKSMYFQHDTKHMAIGLIDRN